MKFMLMMFGSASEMRATADPAWIKQMVEFMTAIDDDLRDRSELVFNAGLEDASTAVLVRGDGSVSSGHLGEGEQSLVGYWVVDVATEARAHEIAASIARYSQVVEVRALGERPDV